MDVLIAVFEFALYGYGVRFVSCAHVLCTHTNCKAAGVTSLAPRCLIIMNKLEGAQPTDVKRKTNEVTACIATCCADPWNIQVSLDEFLGEVRETESIVRTRSQKRIEQTDSL